MRFRPSGIYAKDIDPYWARLRYHYFRITDGHRLPYDACTGQDCFDHDIDLMFAAQKDLEFRRKNPPSGLWFDEFGTCSICGRTTDTVIDHCHVTDLVRGELCKSCNVQEGKSDAPRFVAWRVTAPGLQLGRRRIYEGWGNTYPAEGIRATAPFVQMFDLLNWHAAEDHFVESVKFADAVGKILGGN